MGVKWGGGGGVDRTRYFVELYAVTGGKEETLARTAVFSRPAVLSVHETESAYFLKPPLALLSGINDLPLLREKKGTLKIRTDGIRRPEKEPVRGQALP